MTVAGERFIRYPTRRPEPPEEADDRVIADRKDSNA
jgi:hypothetical protein